MTATLDPGASAPVQPTRHVDPRRWVKQNLFSNVLNSVLTVVFGALLALAGYRLLRFVFVGADWEVVRRNLRLFMVGRMPSDELWRLWASSYLAALGAGFSVGAGIARAVAAEGDAGGRGEGAGAPGPGSGAATSLVYALRRFWPLVLGAVAVLSLTRTVLPSVLLLGVVVVLVAARHAGARAPVRIARWWWLLLGLSLLGSLEVIVGFGGVGWDEWGGLQLTVIVTIAGIAVAFPIGLLLALGRRSKMIAFRWLSVAYIEMFRGVPLITLLFLGQFVIFFMFPTYFNPPGLLVRAMIAIVAFEAAYIAEVVRGGLQSVPQGQYEAAQALGLSPFTMMRRIILPQALRAVIPAMVGQFISLYKDTSLLSIIGVLEVLRVASTAVTQPDFLGQGLDAVTLSFVGFLYWVGCYTMSRESRRLEQRLGVGTR